MNRFIFLFSLFVYPFFSFGIVDTRSAGYSKTFVDFLATDSSYPMEINRTYNSRSIYNGLFGFGWCSNFETRLSVLPDQSIKIVECGGGMEILYHLPGKNPDVQMYVDQILAELKKRKVKMPASKLQKLREDLLNSQNLRADFLKSLDIKGKALRGKKYLAKGRAKETLVYTSRGYRRLLPNGYEELFNNEGRLIESRYKGSKIEISWADKKVEIMDDTGNKLLLPLNKAGKVTQVLYNKKSVAQYRYNQENLTSVVNSEGRFAHEYDSLNNLTKNVYPDKTTEELTYNVKKDWVIAFKDRKNCRESYSYGVHSKNPNHYFSTVEKICGRKVVNKSKYEFWHKNQPGGGKYLARARVKVNGRIQTDVSYHPVFGTPVSFYKNGVRTQRAYFSNGFLKSKDNVLQNVRYSQYNQKCRKPEQVQVSYKNPNPNSKNKILRTESLRFQFDKRCQLLMARKSADEWIRISHNSSGKIQCMEDQSRKKICFKWHKTLNKPELITRQGVGSVKIVYDAKGNILDLKGLKQGPTIVAQVSSVFNSFLTVLSPVAEEMVVL